MRKVNDFVNGFCFDDLKELKDYVDSGLFSREIGKKMNESLRGKVCATCFSDISKGEEIYTLYFGHPEMRKRAHFCAFDCFEFFVKKLRESRENDIRGIKRTAEQKGKPAER